MNKKAAARVRKDSGNESVEDNLYEMDKIHLRYNYRSS